MPATSARQALSTVLQPVQCFWGADKGNKTRTEIRALPVRKGKKSDD